MSQIQINQILMTRKGCVTVVAIAGFIIVLLGALIAFTPVMDGPLGGLQPKCYIGVTYTNASITIQSWTANQDCSQIVNGRNIIPIHFSPGESYLLTEAPQQPVLCEVNQARRHIIVRDEGILDVVGRILCVDLSNSSTQ